MTYLGAISVVLVFMASVVMAPCASAYENPGGYAAYQWKDFYRVWGVSSYMYIANPTYTETTKSLVLAGMTMYIWDNQWLQFGYMEGWYVNSRGYWVELTTPKLYTEYGNLNTGTNYISVSPLTITPGTWHTFKIMFNSATWSWECWFDSSMIYTTSTWVTQTNGDWINVQGECKDDNDKTNGVMHFHSLKYLAYTVGKGGALLNPTWVYWNGYTDADREYPWSMTPSSNEFDCWIN